jgi:hypothetical protein
VPARHALPEAHLAANQRDDVHTLEHQHDARLLAGAEVGKMAAMN